MELIVYIFIFILVVSKDDSKKTGKINKKTDNKGSKGNENSIAHQTLQAARSALRSHQSTVNAKSLIARLEINY